MTTSRTLDELAGEIYGNSPTSQPASTAPSKARTNDELAGALYGSPKQEPARHQSASIAPDRARTTDELAEAFYNSPPAPKPSLQPVMQPAPEKPSKVRTAEELAEALYGKPETETAIQDSAEPELTLTIPDDVRALRAADEDRALNDPQEVYAEAIPDTFWDDQPEIEKIPESQRVAALAEVREMSADLGMTVGDVQELKDLRPVFQDIPSAEQVDEWREESIQLLNKTYGKQAKQALRDAQALIARDPRWVQSLEYNNRGDHPQVMALFARLGRQARLAGKLK